MQAMVRKLFVCAMCLGCVRAEDPPDLLQRVRVHMAGTLVRLPNYTCLQTIQRTERRAPARKFQLIDTVRLEVALVDGKELFAWPGEHKFQDKEINEIVVGGAIGNGNFALHAKSVFSSGAPKFTYMGERIRDDRRTHRWDFEVPQGRSGYVIRTGRREAVVGYHGSFWVDAETLDLIRLEVEADNIPPELRLFRASDAMEYTRTNIGGSMFLLPQYSELHMIDDTNSDSVNRTQFSNCRQYTGESALIFGNPEQTAAQERKIRDVQLPPNVILETTLETPVQSAASAVGDPLTFLVEKGVKKDGQVLVPKGAVLHARLSLLRRQNSDQPAYAVGIKLLELEAPGSRVKFKAALDQIVVSANTAIYRGGTTAPLQWRMERALSEYNETIFGSVFFMKGNELKLPRGLRITWRTRQPDGEDQQ